MPIQPSTPHELRTLYAGNPLIGLAEQALRAFYIISQADAARVLPLWRYYPELTERERSAVLARFDDDADRDNPETAAPLPRGVEGFAPRPPRQLG